MAYYGNASVQWQLLTVLSSVLIWTFTSGAIYKSLMWTTNNPLFQNHNKSGNILKSFCYNGELLLKVHLKSVLPIICPFENLIMQTMDSQPSSGVLYENVWIVYDEESYSKCVINETAEFGNGRTKLKNKLLHKCDSPDKLENDFVKRINFKEDSPVPGELYFEPQTYYYFLATSDGTAGSLNKKSGGHCNNDGDNEIRMKFKVYVCGTNDPKCSKPDDVGVFECVMPPSPTATPSQPFTSSILPSPTVSTVSHVSSSSICANNTYCNKSTLGSTKPESQARKAQDNGWMIFALTLLVVAIVIIVVMACICYRLKKKLSVPCIYSKQISTSPQTSPPGTLEKSELVNSSYDNLAIDYIDGPKKTHPEKANKVEAVEMKSETSPKTANGIIGNPISANTPVHHDNKHHSTQINANPNHSNDHSLPSNDVRNSGNGLTDLNQKKNPQQNNTTGFKTTNNKLPPISVHSGKHGTSYPSDAKTKTDPTPEFQV